MMPDVLEKGPDSRKRSWLNRNVFAFGLTNMLGDVCHEMATAVLPQFMKVIGAGKGKSIGMGMDIDEAAWASFSRTEGVSRAMRWVGTGEP